MNAPYLEKLRRIAGMAGLRPFRDAFFDLELVARISLRSTGRLTTAPAKHDDDCPPFVGDGTLWVQPSDRVGRAGDAVFGWDALSRRAAARRPLTEPVGRAFADGVTEIAAYTSPTWDRSAPPQVMCDASNLAVDFDGLYPTLTTRHHRRYKWGLKRPYHRYSAGALRGACRWSPAFRPAALPRNHLRDIFGSFRPWIGHPSRPYDEVVEHPVLFVTREDDESYNAFHAMTALLNAFETVLVAHDAAPGLPPVARQELEVVLLDNVAPGWIDPLWRRLFAPRRGVRRVGDFGGRRVLFRRAIFSPPGYQSVLFAYTSQDDVHLERVGMLDAFAALVLRSSGCSPEAPRAPGPLRITLVSRRPYETRDDIRRQTANEAACVQALTALGDVEVRLVDFARHPFDQQLRIARDTDLLVGAHGAALTHLLWTPPHAGVLEIAARDGIDWKVFPHMALWTGRPQALIEAPERAVHSGSELIVDVDHLAATARELVAEVRRLSGLERRA